VSDSDRRVRIEALGYDYESLEKVRLGRCNLCGSDRGAVLSHEDRYGFPAPAVACLRCGLTVLDPRLTPEGYGDFYASVYRPLVSAYHGRTIDARTIQDEQAVYSVEMERLVAPFLRGRDGGTMLDVGGSTGIVAAHFARAFGLRPTVLDPAADEIEFAEEMGFEVVTSLMEDWDAGDRRFDVIGMFQTIDHLLDVAGTLRKIRELVAEDGLFVVDVVDFRAAYLKRWEVEQAVKIDHPYSLTEETAEAYFARTGFEVLRKAYSEDKHLVGYVCRPTEPDPDALPSPESVDRFFREVRWVQNAPRPGGGR
jgi:2-polyprenyl-3-methyl-5-hydroxy-6-metoxy-1,4-benzoquinol methylase